tara:strand:- start:4332 stop:5120 length:789 start_codon:yes stop_codon:yes gene_type:complete
MEKSKPLISLIVPVKKVDTRPDMLEACVSSIFENAHDTNNVEVLLGLDEGDSKTLDYVNESIPKKYGKYPIKMFFGAPKAVNFIQEFYEKGYKLSKGDLIWCIGEDVTILTPGYDLKIKEEVVGYPCPYVKVGGRYINGMPDGRNQYCNFPLISRNFEHNGTLLPTNMCSWGVDAYFAMVFEWFDSIGYSQTVDLINDIKIYHLSAHFDDFPKDELYKLQEERGKQNERSGGRDILDSTNKAIEHFYRLLFSIPRVHNWIKR